MVNANRCDLFYDEECKTESNERAPYPTVLKGDESQLGLWNRWERFPLAFRCLDGEV